MEREAGMKGGKGRDLQVRAERKDVFGVAEQKRFLEHFAGTCNVVRSCELAEVKKSTVCKRRTNDTKFRAAWAAAQEQGYAALEAELVRRGLEFMADIGPSEESEKALAGMDAKLILTILQQQGKRIGREPGDLLARPSDLKTATDRLAKLMKRMKLELDQEELGSEAAAGQ